MKQAWEIVLNNCTSFRTGFMYATDSPVQFVLSNMSLPWVELDWKSYSETLKIDKLKDLMLQDRRAGFVLNKPPLFRLTFISCQNSYILSLCYHHLISDGWSLSLIFQHVYEVYNTLKNHAYQSPPDISLNIVAFRNYIEWLNLQSTEEAEKFWRKFMEGVKRESKFPVLNVDAKSLQQDEHQEICIDLRQSQQIKELCIRNGVTLSSFFQTLWGMLLCRYLGTKECIFGVVVSLRPTDLEGADKIIGLLINTLPFRIQPKKNQTVLELIELVQSLNIEISNYSRVQLSKIMSYSGIGENIFNTLFTYANYPRGSLGVSGIDEVNVQQLVVKEKAEYPLTIGVEEQDAFVKVQFNYSIQIPEYRVKWVAEVFECMIESILQNPNRLISSVEINTKFDRDRMLIEWNQTQDTFSNALKSIPELFKEQVLANSNNTALFFQGEQVTFSTLNQKSIDLANYILRSYSSLKNRLIIVCLERSTNLFISYLSVLMLHAVVVPVETNCPPERLKFIIKDSLSSLVITESRFANLFSFLHSDSEFFYECKLLVLDQLASELSLFGVSSPSSPLLFQKHENPNPHSFVIYTSGSTGFPKGVILRTESLINRFEWMWKYYPFENNEICCQKTPIGFVDSLWEMFGPLLKGIPILVISSELGKDPVQMVNVMIQNGVTRIVLVPSLLRIILEECSESNLSNLSQYLKICSCSGEELRCELVKRFRNFFPNTILLNIYGSTEVTADVLYYEVPHPFSGHTIPIGKPISNTKVYILDKNLQPTIIGSIGELCVTGKCLSARYLNPDESSKPKHVPNPFASGPSSLDFDVLYRTNDLARYLSDGNIEFVGRSDLEIKINGSRVSFKDIESLILKMKGMKEVVVVANQRQPTLDDFKEKGQLVSEKLLVTYYRCDQEYSSESFTAHLRDFLPEYMIPKIYMKLNEFPLSTNGKLSRHLLPAPTSLVTQNDTLSNLKNSLALPRSQMEKKLYDIWVPLLNSRNSFGIHDDFFGLGGDSISTIQFCSRLKRQHNIECKVTDLFNYRTIEKLSLFLEEKVSSIGLRDSLAVVDFPQKTVGSLISDELFQKLSIAARLEKRQILEILPANSLQEGFIAFTTKYPDDDAYRMQFLYDYCSEINTLLLREAWELAIQSFPMLRTAFNWEERPIQIIYDQGSLEWNELDFTEVKEEQMPLSISKSFIESTVKRLQEEERRKNFDLSQPLLRLTIIKFSHKSFTMIVTNHHSIMDGWSYQVLFQYVHKYYLSLQEDTKPLIFIDQAYCKAQRYISTHQKLAIDHFREKLHPKKIVLNDLSLLLDFRYDLNTFVTIKKPHCSSISIQGLLYSKLKEFVKVQKVTTNTVAQFIWHKLVQIYTQDIQTVVGTTISGRALPIDDIEDSVGLYINTLPLVINWNDPCDATIMFQLQKFHKAINELNEYSFASLAHLQSTGKRLFHSLFVFENFPESHLEVEKERELSIIFRDFFQKLDYPFGVIVYENDRGLTIDFHHDLSYLCDSKALKILNQMVMMAQQIIDRPYESHQKISILDEADYNRVIAPWNTTKFPIKDQPIHFLFEEMVREFPNNTAFLELMEMLIMRKSFTVLIFELST